MRKLSLWARKHPKTARIIIVLSHLLLLFLAWYTGAALGRQQIMAPGLLPLVSILLYIVAVFMYPDKNQKLLLRKQLFYVKQKCCDFALALAAYGLVFCLANAEQKKFVTSYLYATTAISITEKNDNPTAAEILASLEHRDKSTLSRQEKRILKKEFYQQIKKYTAAKITAKKEKQNEALLIILAIIAALGLLSLLAALACNLSCNGNDAAAVIVGVLGLAGIIIGLIAVIKAIKRKSRNKVS